MTYLITNNEDLYKRFYHKIKVDFESEKTFRYYPNIPKMLHTLDKFNHGKKILPLNWLINLIHAAGKQVSFLRLSASKIVGGPINDNTLSFIAGHLPILSELEFEDCNLITNKGIGYFRHKPHLKNIKSIRCDNIKKIKPITNLFLVIFYDSLKTIIIPSLPSHQLHQLAVDSKSHEFYKYELEKRIRNGDKILSNKFSEFYFNNINNPPIPNLFLNLLPEHTYLKFNPCHCTLITNLKYLKRCSKLNTLILKQSYAETERFFPDLLSSFDWRLFTNLTHLKIEKCEISEESLVILKHLTNLKSLSLKFCSISEDPFPAIHDLTNKLTNLSNLVFKGDRIPETEITKLKKITNLTYLD